MIIYYDIVKVSNCLAVQTPNRKQPEEIDPLTDMLRSILEEFHWLPRPKLPWL